MKKESLYIEKPVCNIIKSSVQHQMFHLTLVSLTIEFLLYWIVGFVILLIPSV